MPRPRTPLLSTDRIADAAMELVDEGAPFGVNAIARRLGVTPSSLYNHVRGRDEIVELMRGRLGERYLPQPGGGAWDEVVEESLRTQRKPSLAAAILIDDPGQSAPGVGRIEVKPWDCPQGKPADEDKEALSEEEPPVRQEQERHAGCERWDEDISEPRAQAAHCAERDEPAGMLLMIDHDPEQEKRGGGGEDDGLRVKADGNQREARQQLR